MTKTIARLADRMLSVVVPRTTAMAEMEYRCVPCYGSFYRQDSRYCAGSCSQWYIGKCHDYYC
ncbi:hypothetical protein [Cryptosporangium sp. NPDC051539]|uniref:hypothetical protein n=1 Tax=Cryptosporangium sp. NPDC051539 TaxID=3363962 RepID=UPI0037B3CD8F